MSLMEVWFSFDGRINRSTFWLKGVLLLIVAGFVIGLITGLLDAILGTDQIITSLASLFMLWPGLAVNAKRWHDRDKSAWWMLIALIPIIGSIWALIETGFLEGTAGPNRFGTEPQ